MIRARFLSSAVSAHALSVPARAASTVWLNEGDLRVIVRDESGADKGENGFERACAFASEGEIVRDDGLLSDDDDEVPLNELDRRRATRAWAFTGSPRLSSVSTRGAGDAPSDCECCRGGRRAAKAEATKDPENGLPSSSDSSSVAPIGISFDR